MNHFFISEFCARCALSVNAFRRDYFGREITFTYSRRRPPIYPSIVEKNETGVRWLYSQLPDLTARGVLSEQAAIALRQHYGTPKERTGVSVLVAMTAVLAALLIGAGIILLLAANWDLFPRVVRTTMAFIPLVLSQTLGAFVLLRRMDSLGWRESAALLNSLTVAAAIALVSQIYHIAGDFTGFLLVWMLLTLPAIYLLRSAAAALLYLWLAKSWTLADTEHHWPWGWLLFAAVLPVMLPMIVRGGMRAWWLAMATMIGGGILLGATSNQANMHGLWIPTFAGYVGLLYVAGVAIRPDELHPFRWVGFAAIGILSLAFTWSGFWSSESGNTSGSGAIAATVICGLAVVAGMVAAAMAFIRNVPVNPFAAAFPIVALAAYGLAVVGEQWAAALLFNLYVFALSVMALRTGLARARFAETNAGMLLLTALIVMRFFDTDVGFLIRGLAFIAAGVGFLVVNILLLQRRKAEA